MKVAIELFNMDSDPGYRPSYGVGVAIMTPTENVVSCGDDSDALTKIFGQEITEDMLDDVEHRTRRSGVCNWYYTTGTFEVPDGFVVICKSHIDICTEDEPRSLSWIVNPDSLRSLYQKRASEYKRLAEAEG